jgi:hypothetical protein
MKSGGNLKRTPLGQGAKSLARGSTFTSRGDGLKRVELKRMSSHTDAASEPTKPTRRPVRFKASTPAYHHDCFRCPDHQRRRAQTWHHWVAQRAIRDHCRGLRLDESAERALLRRLLNDPRNLSPCCRECHNAGEFSARYRFRQDEIPASARQFAAELGPWAVARLDRIGRDAAGELISAQYATRIGAVLPLAQMTKTERRAWLEANPVPRWPGRDPLPESSP